MNGSARTKQPAKFTHTCKRIATFLFETYSRHIRGVDDTNTRQSGEDSGSSQVAQPSMSPDRSRSHDSGAMDDTTGAKDRGGSRRSYNKELSGEINTRSFGESTTLTQGEQAQTLTGDAESSQSQSSSSNSESESLHDTNTNAQSGNRIPLMKHKHGPPWGTARVGTAEGQQVML